MHAQLLSRVRFFAAPWTIAHQAGILEWAAISYSRRSLWPRDQIHVRWTVRHVLLPLSHLERPKKTSRSYPPVPGKVTWTGERVSADVMKLRILKGGHPELRMDPKCSDSRPYKWKEREVEDRTRGAVMLPPAKEHQPPGEGGETRKVSFPRAFGEAWPWLHLDFELWPPELWQKVFLLFKATKFMVIHYTSPRKLKPAASVTTS